MITHPYIKYGIALIMEENSLHNQNEISEVHILNEIKKGLNTFRLKPHYSWEGRETVEYAYTDEDGSAKEYKYLSPHIITTDIQAKNMKGAALKYIEEASHDNDGFLAKNEKIGMSEVPIVGEFASFSKTIGRGGPKATKKEQGFGLVTTLTQYKPAIARSCLIPDLEIPDLIDFICIFKRILFIATEGLFTGNVKIEETKKGKEYIPKRPQIERGNFPHAPQSEMLGSIALLGAIGELGKEANFSEMVKKVLEKLKGCSIYMVKYGEAKSFSFNQYIIELAQNSMLNSVVDSIYYSNLYNQDRRSWDNSEYQKFDLFASRFLLLFNRPSFKDFLSFRAEYPSQIEILITTYFKKIEKMDKQIIYSAKSLGRWLNAVAYKAAVEDKESKLDLKQKKSKILVEIESSIFAAKTPDALFAQTITRAGRLANSDAPAEASLFIEEALIGNLDLNTVKNMLIAFSRIRTLKNSTSSEDSTTISQEDKTCTDFSQI